MKHKRGSGNGFQIGECLNGVMIYFGIWFLRVCLCACMFKCFCDCMLLRPSDKGHMPVLSSCHCVLWFPEDVLQVVT